LLLLLLLLPLILLLPLMLDVSQFFSLYWLSPI
jgi:hypothetical protein